MLRFIIAVILVFTFANAQAAEDINPQLYGATVSAPVTIVEYLRVRAIGVQNKLGETPALTMYREKCQTFSDNRTPVCTDAGPLVVNYDPSYTFPLRNPQDGTSLGTSNFAQLYVIFDSLFRAKQAEDEARIAAEAAAE